MQVFPSLLETHNYFCGLGLGVHTPCLSRLLYFLAVLVNFGEKIRLRATQPGIAGQDVCQDSRIGVIT